MTVGQLLQFIKENGIKDSDKVYVNEMFVDRNSYPYVITQSACDLEVDCGALYVVARAEE